MNSEQEELMELIIKLDLKANEYNKIAKQLEVLKSLNVDPNDERLIIVKNFFLEISKEIMDIKLRLKDLQGTN